MKKEQTQEAELLIILGSRIRQIRQAKGITQMKLAALCNFEKSSMSRLESGQTNTTVLTLKKIADVLEVSLPQLLLWSD